MRKSIVMAVVAGVASAASAQTASLSIVASTSVIDTTVETTLTLDVYGDSSIGTHITGVAFSIDGTVGSNTLITDMVASSAGWGALGFDDLGHTGGGDSGMIMGQIVFLPFIQPDPLSALGNGPVYLGSFVVTFATDIYLDVEWVLGGGIGSFVMEVIDVNANPDDNPPGEMTQITDVAFGGVSVQVVPAPSAMALLGLGGLVAGRRRR